MRNPPKIGFMQGRLSPIINGRTQAFPFGSWQKEFEIASMNGFDLIEWTIDSVKFFENPLMSLDGRLKILELCRQYGIRIPSVTCDYFMENPPWLIGSNALKQNIVEILAGMNKIGAKLLIIPLVDNASLKESRRLKVTRIFFESIVRHLQISDIRVAFETDLDPKHFAGFISDFDHRHFGINYDIGNSASLNYDPEKEFESYGERILNVHIKDRKIGGKTLPLGQGDADFLKVFRELRINNYHGNLILQTARASDNNHVKCLVEFREFTEKFWKESVIE